MANILEFLRHVLPADGLKCATLISEGRAFNRFFATFEDLANYLTAQDALGFAAYHACSSFKTSDNRKADNALAARSFWQDLDAGEGKHYATPQAAYEAVCRFCTATHLPLPVIVGSGSGLHTYWPLVEALDPVRWRACAERLFELCKEHGLHVDPARSRDLASILRPPGTYNRKHGGHALVQCGKLEGPYTLEQLGAINAGPVRALLGDLQRQDTAPMRGGLSRPAPRNLASAAAIKFNELPSDVDLVFERCGQIRRLFESYGQVSDPDWYAAVGVLHHCVGGHEFAHECAAPEWHDAIDKKFAQKASGDIGPTRCDHFRSINPSGCESCPFADRIATPLQLGRADFAVTRTAPPPELRPMLGNQPHSVDHVGGCLAVESFAVTDKGLVFNREDSNGQAVFDVVSPYPLYLAAVQTDEDGARYSLCYYNHIPSRPVQEIVVSAGELYSQGGRSKLADLGAVIVDMDQFRHYSRLAQEHLTRTKTMDTRYEQFGWKNEEQQFVIGNRVYENGAHKPAAGSVLLAERTKFLGPRAKGSLQEWQLLINPLFQVGHEAQSFVVLASFAATFMRFHQHDEGGAVISLYTPDSGKGKTTALEAASSVWGLHDGIRVTNRDTMNAKGILLGAMGNLPIVYDEITAKDPVLLYEAIQDFTNGKDRARATAEGGLRQQKAKWQTLLFTAQNKSLVETIMSVPENQDAMQFRIIELPVSFDKTQARQGEEMRRQLPKHAGYAGDVFLQYITRPAILAWCRATLPKMYEHIYTKYGFSPEHRYWVRTLSAVALAGVIVRQIGLVDCSADRIIEWAAALLQGRIGDATVTGHNDAASMLTRFMDAHQRGRLIVRDAFMPRQEQQAIAVPTDALVYRLETQTKMAYIAETALRQWIVKNSGDWASFKQELVRERLGKFGHRTLGAGTPFASGQTKVIEVNLQHSAFTGIVADVIELKPNVTNTRQDRLDQALK